MASITNAVRNQLEALLRDEIRMVQAKAAKVADAQWREAERRVAEDLGYSAIVIRIEHLQNEIEGLQRELTELEAGVHEKAQAASVEDYRQAGIDIAPDRYGRVYGKPEVFGRQIISRYDTLVLKHLNAEVPFFRIHFSLTQLQHTVRRELLLCGNFEEARSLYQRFHEKIGKAIGDDMPGLLQEVNALPALKAPEDLV